MNREMKIIKGFEEEEVSDFYTKMFGSNIGYDKEIFPIEMANDNRFIYAQGDIDDDAQNELEEYLQDLGIPFITYECSETGEMTVFDGVRKHSMICTKDKTPLVEVDAIREIIDLLETPEDEDPYADMRALVKANENWIETNIDNMWRYGMENSVAFSSNFNDPNKDAIDVDIEEEDGGNPEITKKIDS